MVDTLISTSSRIVPVLYCNKIGLAFESEEQLVQSILKYGYLYRAIEPAPLVNLNNHVYFISMEDMFYCQLSKKFQSTLVNKVNLLKLITRNTYETCFTSDEIDNFSKTRPFSQLSYYVNKANDVGFIFNYEYAEHFPSLMGDFSNFPQPKKEYCLFLYLSDILNNECKINVVECINIRFYSASNLSDLFELVESNDLEQVESELLRNPHRVTERATGPSHIIPKNMTESLLHHSLLKSSIEMTTLLIKLGADVNSTEWPYGSEEILIKSFCDRMEEEIPQYGDVRVANIKLLFDSGVNLNADEMYDLTYEMCMYQANVEIIKMLIDYSKRLDHLPFAVLGYDNSVNDKIRYSNQEAIELLEYLIKHDADIHNKLNSKSLLFAACTTAFDIDVPMYLIEAGVTADEGDFEQYGKVFVESILSKDSPLHEVRLKEMKSLKDSYYR